MGTGTPCRRRSHKVTKVYIVVADYDESTSISQVYTSKRAAESAVELANGLTKHYDSNLHYRVVGMPLIR